LNKKRICLVTSGHPPFDERIFWKFGKSLYDASFAVSIFCSTLEIDEVRQGISIKGFFGTSYPKNKKIEQFYTLINDLDPDLIICSETLPAIAALKYSKQSNHTKTILDITEWHPENVAYKYKGIKRWLKYFQLFIPYLYVLQKVDHLIIGEKNKKSRYDLLARKKPKTIVGYYPVLTYFNYVEPDLSKKKIVLGYAGVITLERGIDTLLNISIKISKKYPNNIFKLLLFGKFTYSDEEIAFKSKIHELNNFKVEFVDWTDYDKMGSVIGRMDLCFDLRNQNFIYRNSLPIKIFEYMACGKPFIYSNIQPVKEELDYKQYGFLVNPEDENEIVNIIQQYLENPKLAKQHSQNARKIIERNKNWENESIKLIELVNSLLST
jgi:glycosyltransferase involved in cell wall biosynthesis